MPWEVPIKVGETEYPVRFDGDSEPTKQEIDEAGEFLARQHGPSALGAGLRSAARSVIPAFGGGRLGAMIGGGIGGAIEGAVAGSEIPIWGNIIGGLVGAGLGMYGAGKAQEKLADVINPSESNIFSTASQEADVAAQPLASEIGGLAIFKPNPLKLGRALTGALTQEGRNLVAEGYALAKAGKVADLTAKEAQAMKAFQSVSEVAGNVGLGSGMGALQGGDLQSVVKSAGIGALFNDSWLHGHTTPVHEVSEHPAANGTSYPRLGYTPEETPPIVTPSTAEGARQAELQVPLTPEERVKLDTLRSTKENWPVDQGEVFAKELSDLEARDAQTKQVLGLPAPQQEPIVTPSTKVATELESLNTPLSDAERQRLDFLRQVKENWPVDQGAPFNEELSALESREHVPQHPREVSLPDGRKFVDDGTGWRNAGNNRLVTNDKLSNQLNELHKQSQVVTPEPPPVQLTEPTHPIPIPEPPRTSIESGFDVIDERDAALAEKVRKAQEEAKAAQQNPDTQAAGLALEEKLPELVKSEFTEQQAKMAELEAKRQEELQKEAEKVAKEKEQQAKQEEDAAQSKSKEEPVQSTEPEAEPKTKITDFDAEGNPIEVDMPHEEAVKKLDVRSKILDSIRRCLEP